MNRGKLIVFEGLDRAGKSTQCLKLVEHLLKQQHRVKHVQFPDRTTPIGTKIDEYLRGNSQLEDHVIHLLFSANRWELAASIQEAIAAGTTVVVDRYLYSGCVYSAAKSNPHLSLRWARHPEQGLPRPDVCLFLQLSPEEAAARGGWGQERYERAEMQARVRTLFDAVRASSDGEDFVVVDAGQAVDKVHADILKVVESTFERVDGGGLPLREVGPCPSSFM